MRVYVPRSVPPRARGERVSFLRLGRFRTIGSLRTRHPVHVAKGDVQAAADRNARNAPSQRDDEGRLPHQRRGTATMC